MRLALASAFLLSLTGLASAQQDNPACAKFKNDFEYNSCLARLGPKAGAAHDIAPAANERAVSRSGGVVATRNKRGRMEAVFDLTPKK
jgi:hypothetical protein